MIDEHSHDLCVVPDCDRLAVVEISYVSTIVLPVGYGVPILERAEVKSCTVHAARIADAVDHLAKEALR